MSCTGGHVVQFIKELSFCSYLSTASIPSSGLGLGNIDITNSNERDILKLYSSRSLTSSGADSLTDGDIIFCRDS